MEGAKGFDVIPLASPISCDDIRQKELWLFKFPSDVCLLWIAPSLVFETNSGSSKVKLYPKSTSHFLLRQQRCLFCKNALLQRFSGKISCLNFWNYHQKKRTLSSMFFLDNRRLLRLVWCRWCGRASHFLVGKPFRRLFAVVKCSDSDELVEREQKDSLPEFIAPPNVVDMVQPAEVGKYVFTPIGAASASSNAATSAPALSRKSKRARSDAVSPQKTVKRTKPSSAQSVSSTAALPQSPAPAVSTQKSKKKSLASAPAPTSTPATPTPSGDTLSPQATQKPKKKATTPAPVAPSRDHTPQKITAKAIPSVAPIAAPPSDQIAHKTKQKSTPKPATTTSAPSPSTPSIASSTPIAKQPKAAKKQQAVSDSVTSAVAAVATPEAKPSKSKTATPIPAKAASDTEHRKSKKQKVTSS